MSEDFTLPPTDEAIRRSLFQRVNLLMAGEPVVEGAHVSADCLVACIAVLSHTLEDADAIIDALVPDLKERVRLYWADVQAAHATGETRRPAGRA